jgi:Zn finger protein HypA/HybF involved in hydrogenase expression
MHEVSLVADLVDECVRRAGSAPVRRVRIRHASTIPLEVVQQAFDMLTACTALAGAQLDADEYEIQLHCGCGYSGVVPDEYLVGTSIAVCPACETVSIRAATPEIELLDIVT